MLMDMMGKMRGWVATHRKRAIAGAIGATLVVAGVAGATWATGGWRSAAAETGSESGGGDVVEVAFDIDAPGWKDGSSAAVATLTPTGADERTFSRAVDPTDAKNHKGTAIAKLIPGKWKIRWVPPVNADGSTYRAPKETAFEIEAASDGRLDAHRDKNVIKARFEALAEPTDAELAEIIANARLAVGTGDETLKGDAGKRVVTAIETNAAAAPSAGDKVRDAAQKEAEPTPETPGAAGGGDPATGESERTDPATGDPSKSGRDDSPAQADDSGSGASPKPGPTPTPSGGGGGKHGHWETRDVYTDVPRYENRWVSNWVDVPAKTSKKLVIEFTFSDGHKAHSKEELRTYSMSHINLNFSDTSYYTTVVDVPAHREDRGSYQRVQTGTDHVKSGTERVWVND
ncbi:hypothetical protein Corgl_0218 [Coriobacterium glomerans PW2]|uniref:Uncharacterized protein n=1 Tax=Coriobacterium glomerans (strain ATCC 49209 / DSM 20642 / JCM 10262 / PW2) TaxID=700015 RepID=F2N706_CORGP|nr:hypothetical protein [Coriobacterium glomerans]AEB06345.1 hypothetical protein Corgl_0218 [Coriobacterium glomerans PW2]